MKIYLPYLEEQDVSLVSIYMEAVNNCSYSVVHVYIHVQYMHPSIHPPTRLPARPPTCLPTHPPIHPSIHFNLKLQSRCFCVFQVADYSWFKASILLLSCLPQNAKQQGLVV